MKNLTILIILLALFGFTSAFSQEQKTATKQEPSSVKALEDPKLSPEEQAQIARAGEDNPAKIDEASVIDPKINPEDLPTEEDYGVSNARPSEDGNTDEKLIPEKTRSEQVTTPGPFARPAAGTGQPAGEKSGEIPDYRMMQGGVDQPQGDTPKNIPDYGKAQGSGQQPAGDIPKK